MTPFWKWLARCLMGAALAGAVLEAAMVPARAENIAWKSSGGYSRPSAPSFRRPPIGGSFGSGAPWGGGYRRAPPAESFGSARRSWTPPPSASDRAIARQQAEEALRNYRSGQIPGGAPPPAPDGVMPFGGIRAPRGEGGWNDGAGLGGRRSWFAQRGWSPPAYVQGAPRGFGIWDGVFLWFLLDTLSQPGHARFFYDHQNDPGYQEWRGEADRLAQSNEQLRGKLDRLDRQLAERQGEKRDPNYVPPDTPPEVAVSPRAERAASSRPLSSSPGAILAVVAVGGGILFLLWLGRRHRNRPPSNRQGGPGMEPLKTAFDTLRRHVTGEPYHPSLFRVGMTITLDPTPFILAASATKVPVPTPSGQNLLVSVQAVGTLGDGVTLYRLYLDERSFFQLHLGGDTPDECRFFGRIDQVAPANGAEWGFWIDPNEGVIGWPEFQTKDGKIYERAWASGQSRIPPHRFTETRQDLSGTRVAKLEAMLYAGPTNAAPPAPEAEYILVAMVEEGGQAWIDIHAGIDVNPAALSLA